ncbi:MAG: lysophospholipase [Spirochaetaceae bacterium]|jgi:esterase/lipase|nr:lysophospholipase [Spirochaetaceae bacterium]
MKDKYWIFAALLILNPHNSLYAENQDEAPRYWETAVPNPRGVVVVAHGLNVKPSKMGTPLAEGTLVKLLIDSGFHVYRVALKGHYGSIADMQDITQSDWMRDAYSQYLQAKTFAESAGTPLYLLGFSLGALVYELLMNEETPVPVRFEKAILFSPAAAIKPVAKAVLWLQPFTGVKSIIRSASPKEYRAQTGASIAAYKAVFAMEKSLRSASFRNCNINTIIFIDKNDEIVSARMLRKMINQYGLTNWKIHEITNLGAVIKPKRHHLLIDCECVSAATWLYISKTILDLF